MSRLGGIALATLLLVAGLAVPAQSQESDAEPMRWPYFEAEHLILPPEGERDFGHDVDTDGERILVAAREAAYLYERDADADGGWKLEAKLDPPSGTTVWAVSLGDGHAAVSTGAKVDVWRVGDGWTQNVPGGGSYGDVLLRDGYLFVAHPHTDAVMEFGARGEVLAYRQSQGSYALRQTLTEPSGTVQRIFGADLALRDDVLVVGTPARTLTEQAAPGAAHVYQRQGTSWSLQTTVEAARGSSAASSFGHKVATTGDAVVVSASTRYFGSGDDPGSGWTSIYEPGSGGWRKVQEVSTDATAIAARDDAILMVDWWWSIVGVHMREGEYFDCYNGPWCEVGFLGGWESFYGDNPFPEALAMQGRVAVLGAPSEYVDDQTRGAVLAYYDNALPRAVGLPQEPVQDADEDGRELVTLDGSHSYDPDGTIVSYAWYKGKELLADEPFVDVDLPLGTHTFRLEVTDDLGGVGKADVAVVVQTPQLGLDIHYCCSGYFDDRLFPDRPVYFWADVQDHRAGVKHWDWDFDGDGATDSTEANPRQVFPHGGTWDVTLTVTNEAGDQMTTVLPVEVRNKAPVADAGLPRVVTVDATGLATVTLDGSGSTDPDGEVEGHDWLRQDPVAGTYSTVASGEKVEVQVTRGVNRFLLWAIDDDGARGQAYTTVIAINPGQNRTGTPPSPDFTAKDLGDRSLFLEDHSKPGDAAIVAWTWGTDPTDQQNGNRQHVMGFDEPGDHKVRLTVYDADGRDRGVTNTVRLGDEPPELSAWPLGGTVPAGAHVTLLAHADDEAPDALAWQWSLDGTPYSDHQDAGHTFTKLGNHTVAVRVTDDQGNTASLDGWLEVIPEEEFRERFGDHLLDNATEEEGGLGVGTGVFEEPDEAIQEELERRRAGGTESTDQDGDGEDDADDGDGPQPLAATTPRTPGGASPLTWAIVAIAVALLALLAVETERRRRHRARRRARYEANMKARLARHEPPVDFRAASRPRR